MARVFYSECIVAIFLERFGLVLCATAFYNIVIGNSMKLDIHYRAGIGLVLVGIAYLLGHTVLKTNQAQKAPATAHPSVVEIPKINQESENSTCSNAVAIDGTINCAPVPEKPIDPNRPTKKP